MFFAARAFGQTLSGTPRNSPTKKGRLQVKQQRAPRVFFAGPSLGTKNAGCVAAAAPAANWGMWGTACGTACFSGETNAVTVDSSGSAASSKLAPSIEVRRCCFTALPDAAIEKRCVLDGFLFDGKAPSRKIALHTGRTHTYAHVACESGRRAAVLSRLHTELERSSPLPLPLPCFLPLFPPSVLPSSLSFPQVYHLATAAWYTNPVPPKAPERFTRPLSHKAASLLSHKAASLVLSTEATPLPAALCVAKVCIQTAGDELACCCDERTLNCGRQLSEVSPPSKQAPLCPCPISCLRDLPEGTLLTSAARWARLTF